MYENPWECDCDSEKLTQISSVNHNYNNVDGIRCKNYNELLFQVNFSDKCNVQNSDNNEYSFSNGSYDFPYETLGLVIILNCLVLTTFCVYYYQQKIKSWVRNIFCNECLYYIAENEEKDKLFNGYTSYSHKDGDFIFSELVPKLD